MKLVQNKTENLHKYTPIYANLFSIRSEGIDKDILDLVYGYEIDVITKTISLDLNIFLEQLRLIKRIKTNRIDISYSNGDGEEILKRSVYDLIPLGYSSKGNYDERNELLKIRLSWKYNDLFSFPE